MSDTPDEIGGFPDDPQPDTYDPAAPVNQCALDDLTDDLHRRGFSYFLVGHVSTGGPGMGRTTFWYSCPLLWSIGAIAVEIEDRERKRLARLGEPPGGQLRTVTTDTGPYSPETAVQDLSVDQLLYEIGTRLTDYALLLQDHTGDYENNHFVSTYGGSEDWIIGALHVVQRRQLVRYLDPKWNPPKPNSDRGTIGGE